MILIEKYDHTFLKKITFVSIGGQSFACHELLHGYWTIKNGLGKQSTSKDIQENSWAQIYI